MTWLAAWRACAALCALLWLASLPLPAVGEQLGPYSGWQMLLFGFMGLLMMQLGWFLNLLLWPALWLLVRRSPLVWQAGCALGGILLALLLSVASWSLPPGPLIIEHKTGYWLWMVAMSIAAAALFARGFVDRDAEPEQRLAGRTG